MRSQVIVLLFFIQSMVSCQQIQDKAQPFDTVLAMHASNDQSSDLSNTNPTVANIIFRSKDGGQTWQNISAGLPTTLDVRRFFTEDNKAFLSFENNLYHFNTSSSIPLWEKDAFLINNVKDIYAGPHGLIGRNTEGDLLQKTNSSISWLPIFTSLPDHSVTTIVETVKGTLLACSRSGIYRSIDGGITWKHSFDKGWVIEMVESNGVILCTNDHGILRSADEGEHWDLVISEGGVGIALEKINGGFAAITYNTDSKTRRVRTSFDGGKSWQAIDGGGLAPDASITSIIQVGKQYFCGHPQGIFSSLDGGNTWQLILPSVDKKIFNLTVSEGVIYAIPRNGGC